MQQTHVPSTLPHDQNEPTKEVRRHFLAMVATYSLDVFNDQFFKQTAILLAFLGSFDKLPGYIQLIFMLPYVLLGAPAGWLADRFAKRTVIIAAKLLELIGVVIAAYGIFNGSWTIILTALAIMGLRANIFSPAMNGSIPELFSDDEVTKANGLLKMFTTGTILSGIALAGFALNIKGTVGHHIPTWHFIIAGSIIAVAIIGLFVSFGVPHKSAAAPDARFPWLGPITTLGQLWRVRKDSLLFITIFADAYSWFLGSLLVLLITALGMKQFGFNSAHTSILVAAEVVGVAIGGLMSGRLAVGERWYKILPSCGVLLGASLLLVSQVPSLSPVFHLPVLLCALAIAGIAGGLFLIPLESFIQVRPAPQEKGSVISVANFAAFTGMLLAAPVYNGLHHYFIPSTCFAVMGVVTIF
ncbi:MAG TPA: MFS transporter, partial [Armatimonadota bacterium]|nr:MFS transporter [Armatimonadota bacterium]